MMQSQRVGEKTELRADSLILPWPFILDGYDKAILTIIVGKICDTLSLFGISSTAM